MDLNQSQQTAVKHGDGPLLIIAGAGTGKTTVVTERIKYLIETRHLDPAEIFAATFTEKAAAEMLARLDVVMPLGYREPWLGTFHGLCDRLLREEGLEMGLNPNFNVMTQTDQWIFLKEHLFDLNLSYYRPLGNPNRFISAIIKYFSRLADEFVAPAAFLQLAREKTDAAADEGAQVEASRLTELAAAYVKYQQLKHDHSVLDFGDLITLSVELFRTRPNILNKYQTQFKHILVDEFQDTNYAQFELIKLLAPPQTHPNLVVVGDDDQSVYKFRGASVSNILEFKSIYPDAQEVVLTSNYRSTQPILDSAYQSITHNNPDRLEAKLNLQKKLASQLSSEIQPEIFKFDTIEDEVNWTVEKIYDLVTQHNLTYKDIAIIARANSHLEPYVLALKSAGLPYQLVANHGLFDQEEIKTLLTFMRVVADPTDTVALFQLTQSPIFNLKPELVLGNLNLSKTKSTSLWDELKQETDAKTKKLIALITRFQAVITTTTVSQFLYQLVEDTQYLRQFTQVESVENQLKIKNLNLFFGRLKRYEIASEDKSILGFLSTLDLWLEAGENPGQAQIEDIDTIALMTIHAAKGLEFDAVFVTSMVAGRFPSTNRKDPIDMPVELIKEKLPEGDEHMEEERRLFYVALTRAKRFLYLTFAEDVGGTRKRKMSGFLTETGLPVKVVDGVDIHFKTHAVLTPPQPKYLKGGQYVIDKVSYTQLDTFDTCPLKYKYRYLLQIPTKPHHSLSFGQTIHQTLYEFHLSGQQGKYLTKDQLLALYHKNFIEVGYTTPEHKRERFEAGLHALSAYYDQSPMIFGKPLLLEQPFNLKLDHATLIGKIDRIDQTADGGVEIIDYKTGAERKRDQKTIDKDPQLTLYALAATKALQLPVAALSLYFLEGGAKVTTTRTAADIDLAQTKLERRIHDIQTSDFPAKADPVKCGFCEYQPICPFARPKKS